MKKYRLINNLKQEKIIFAENLDEAERRANKIWKKWIEIRICNEKKIDEK